MQFDDVYPSGEVIDSLSRKCGCQVAVIPFMDCMPGTSYLVSEDGRTVFVSIDFGGYCQVKKIAIVPAGRRSKNSKPSFMRRNRNGFRNCASLPTAVYAAFVLKEIPRYKLSHIDGNPNNCRVGNLIISGSSTVRKNIDKCAILYKKKYDDMVNFTRHFRWMSIGKAQDFVSEAFLTMCESRKEIDLDAAPELWGFLAKRKSFRYFSRNRIEYELYDKLQNIGIDDFPEGELDFQKLLDSLPPDCRNVADLLLAGYNQYEIAARMRVSQPWISLLLKKTKKILAKYDYQN